MGNMEHFAWRAFFALFVDMEPATYIPNDYLLSLFYCFTLETIAMIDFPNLQSASWECFDDREEDAIASLGQD